MATIPTLDQITGNTVMQKFRSLAKAVIATMEEFGTETDYIVSDLTPRLEQAIVNVNESIGTMQGLIENDTLLQERVEEGLTTLNQILPNLVTTNTNQIIGAYKTFSGGILVEALSAFSADLQLTNGASLSVSGMVDCANSVSCDELEVREQGEVAGMSFEKSGTKTVISNDNGIESGSPVNFTNVLTTTTGVRDTKAANGTRIQNDLDNYAPMMRITDDQDVYGIKTFTNTLFACPTSLIVQRGIGHHKVYSFGKNTTTKYLGLRVNDRYNYATGQYTISFDDSVTPAKITISGSSTSTIGRTYIGVMYDEDNDEYLLIVNRVSGNNIYTKIIVDFCQLGTASINNVIVPNVVDEMITVPENYNEVVLL